MQTIGVTPTANYQVTSPDFEKLSIQIPAGDTGELALLAGVERCHRAVVTHHARPHLAALAFVVAQRERRGGLWLGAQQVIHRVVSSSGGY